MSVVQVPAYHLTATEKHHHLPLDNRSADMRFCRYCDDASPCLTSQYVQAGLANSLRRQSETDSSPAEHHVLSTDAEGSVHTLLGYSESSTRCGKHRHQTKRTKICLRTKDAGKRLEK
mmetsp:Transcript_12985/g.51969  ORF Transcript_12985/g.51969 Transcript_12985/m.51969 type:complete len:118 (-) Transcript_12985:195-548(-)